MTNDETPAPWPQDDDANSRADLADAADALADEFSDLAMTPDGEIVMSARPLSLGAITTGGAWDPDAGGGDVPGEPDPPHSPPAPDPAPSGRVEVLPARAHGRDLIPHVGGRMLDGVTVASFHVVRSPWYALRGLGAIVGSLTRWVTRPEDAEQFAADLKAAGSVSARSRLRGERARARIARLALASTPLWAAWAWIEFGRWGILPVGVLAASYVALAVAGWRAVQQARTPRERAVRRQGRPVLSRPFVTEALDLVDCGTVKRPTGDVAGPTIWSASHVSGGEVMVIDLPAGIPVSKLLKRHEEFAGALGRPAECVVIEPQPRISPQRFELFVAARRLDEKGAVTLPWTTRPRRSSFFEPVPVGVDTRGRAVLVPLFESHGLIAGAMGMGKSFSARLLLLWAALDPRVRLLIHNMKGGPDYRGFAPVAHTLRSGSGPADLEALATDLAWMQAEIGRRGRVLASLPAERVPDGKLTDEIASDEDMGPVVLLIDEAQRAFSSKRGQEIAAMLEDVERTGRSVGFHVELVTQGTKGGVIPSGILDQLVHRIGHGVTSISDANLILGSDAHGRTYRAVDIETPGVAYVGMAGGRLVKTAMAKVNLPHVEQVVAAAAELRRQAATLSGMAAGDVPGDEHDGGLTAFLTDVLAVWPAGDRGRPWRNVKSQRLATLLADARPDDYADLGGEDGGAVVSRRMREAGVKVSSQRTPDGDGRGVKRVDVERAASALGGS